MVSQELREILVPREKGERLEFQDPEERTVPRGRRVELDPLVSSDLLDPLERRVNLVYLEFLDILEDKGPRDRLDSLDSPVLMARKEQGVSLEKQDQEDKEDQRDQEAREDPEALPGKQEQRERLEVMVLLVLLERGDCPGLREPTVSPDQRDLPDHQEKMDCLDILDREEKLVSKVKWVLLGLQVLLDLRGPQVKPALWVSAAIPDPQGHQESRDCLDRLVRRARREILAPPEVPVRMDPQD